MWSLKIAVFLLIITTLHASHDVQEDDWGYPFFPQFPVVRQQSSWNSVPKTRIGEINLQQTGTYAFSLPSVIPSSAVEVLVFVRNWVLNNPTSSSYQYIKIYTQDNDEKRYEKYLFVHSLEGQDAVTYNSDNLWFPATPDRVVFVDLTRSISRANLALDVIGYR